MNYPYVPIDRIFSKLIRDVTDDFDEGDVIEWCGEALEFIGATRLYEEAIAFVEVTNHQCRVPAGTHMIMQIGRDNRWSGPKISDICPAKIITSSATTSDTPPAIPVALDCFGQPISEFELAYYRPYFDLKWEHSLWLDSSFSRERFTPIRLATGNFFGEPSIHCQPGNDEYKIIKGQIIRFSFRDGLVAIAYNRTLLDEETGYPLIPDNISYTTAIVKYISLMMLNKQCIAGRQGACGLAEKADRDWQWYCKQASNVDLMPYGDDEYQNLLDQRSHILPKTNRYYGFFGKMARPEVRKYNDPDMRNWHGYYFRGY